MNVTEHPILARTAHPTSLSEPADFTLAGGHRVPLARVFAADVSPYCFDLERGLLLCVSTPPLDGSTFFYQAQRRTARTVLRVPVALLPDRDATATLIFSIGRCGSTLLFRAFEAAGVRIVSEPDFFTQAALHGIRMADDSFLRVALRRAARLLPYSAIKLRLECNSAPALIAGAYTTPTILFVLRDPVAWAASHHRQSRNTIDAAFWARMLRGSLQTLAWLAAHHRVHVTYYEDFRDLSAASLAAVLAATGWQGTLDQARLDAVAARDSHDGSAEEDVGASVPEDPAFRAAFAQEWARVRPADLIARLGLRGL